jgi:hypothetical protein
MRDMARAFADEKIALRALEWDEKKLFPRGCDPRKAADLNN